MVKTVLLSYFDMATKEFLQTRATVVDDSDPSVDYIPYNATEVIAPDKTTWPAHTYPVFNGTGWDMVPDYRGVTFYNVLTQETKEYELGETPDTTNYVDVAPTAAGTEWSPLLRQWTITLESTRLAKKNEIEASYNNHVNSFINTGIKARSANSSSLVDVVIKINNDKDMTELPMMKALSIMRSRSTTRFTYKMADGTSVILSADELKMVCDMQYMNFMNAKLKLSELTTRLEMATTIEEINRIVW